ncbi:hypothetical protein ACM66B_007012 [Microbotryomycetes sp. NB124-2]
MIIKTLDGRELDTVRLNCFDGRILNNGQGKQDLKKIKQELSKFKASFSVRRLEVRHSLVACTGPLDRILDLASSPATQLAFETLQRSAKVLTLFEFSASHRLSQDIQEDVGPLEFSLDLQVDSAQYLEHSNAEDSEERDLFYNSGKHVSVSLIPFGKLVTRLPVLKRLELHGVYGLTTEQVRKVFDKCP